MNRILTAIGACNNDVVFTSEIHGSFNVTRAMIWAQQYGKKTISDMCFVRSSIENILRDVDLDPKRLAEVRLEQELKPVLFVETKDGTLLIIDGYDRLKIALERDLLTIEGLLIPHQYVKQFEVPNTQEGKTETLEGVD